MNNPDKIFKEKLYDLETPLGGSVSFEKVMAKRNTSAGAVWWKPALLVFATLSVVSLTGFFFYRENGSKAVQAELADLAAQSKGHTKAIERKAEQPQNTTLEMPASTNATQPSKTNISTVVANTKSNKGTLRSTSTKGTLVQSDVHTNAVAVLQTKENKDFDFLKSFGVRMGQLGSWNVARLMASPSVLHDIESANSNDAWKPSIEITMFTGNHQLKGFSGKEGTSIRGSQLTGQYTAVALWNLKYGIQLGAGIGFSQFIGSGEWMNIINQNKQQITSRQVTIIQPGLPDRTITVYDTANVKTQDISRGNVSYRLNKVSVPLAFRMHFGEGRALLRVSGTISPGFISHKSGNIFSNTEYVPVSKVNAFTLDSRLGVGCYYTLTTKMALFAEPSVNYQSFAGNRTGYNKVNLGFGLGVIFKP